MSELPRGWGSVALGEISEYITSGSRDWSRYYADVGALFIRTQDINKNRLAALEQIARVKLPEKVEGKRTLIQQGDLLITITGANVGKCVNVVQALPEAYVSQSVALVRLSDKSLAPFVHYQLITPTEQEDRTALQMSAYGLGRPVLNLNNIRELPLKLAPLKEQKRITDKLDALLTRVDTCRDRLNRVPLILKRFRQSVLAAATSGQLTENWRALNADLVDATDDAETLRIAHADAGGHKRGNAADPTDEVHDLEPDMFPKGWHLLELRDLVYPDRPITYGILKPGPEVENGVPYIRVADFPNDELDVSTLRKTSAKIDAKFSRSRLMPGDILLSIRGTVGRLVVIPPELAGANITQDSARLSIQASVERDYVLWFLRSELAQTRMKRSEKGVAVRGINIGDVRALQVPLPSRREQKEIVCRVEALFAYADRLEARLQTARTQVGRLTPALLAKAFRGELVSQDPNDEPASVLLKRIQAEKSLIASERNTTRIVRRSAKESPKDTMKQSSDYSAALRSAFAQMGRKADARQLFDQAGFSPDEVMQFYEVLRATPEVRVAFEEAMEERPQQQSSIVDGTDKSTMANGRFRLVELWLEDFKNLTDYTVHFDPSHGIDIVLGWNGTGKSNLFEALVIIFRDLHKWWEKNQWTENPMKGYRLRYEIDEKTVEVSWHPGEMKRPKLKMGILQESTKEPDKLESITRKELPLPRFVFGYYSGPTNRLVEHFWPMKKDHYDRLRTAESDDLETLARLLQQRRFFCAENHHAKYVLLAFFHKDDADIRHFLEDRLRIVGFESALFIIRKPAWARPGQTAKNFWGATGIMRRVMERLRRYAIAPMVVEQTISDGYRSRREDHYYFFLPDLKSLHAFAAEYHDARTFFVALESTDFSELIYDLKIQVRVKATNTEQVAITFHELSEGEQQLLMVLGLMRFTKSHQSLVLLDEPDTHLNPHWSVDYLKLLTRVMSEDSSESEEQQTSQILMSTHDPLVIASLFKEQIHLLKRDWQTGVCKWTQPTVNPRGLGFTGILTSEMFGMRSDLDEETLADLDNKVRLVAKAGSLTPDEITDLEEINKRLEDAGFQKAFSDPYYAAFVRAWGRRHSELMAGVQFLSPEKQEEIDRIAREVLEESLAELQAEAVD